MRLRMISNCVPSRCNFPDQPRFRRGIATDQEERCLCIVPVEKFKQRRCDRWVWAVVERKSERPRVICESNGWAEELGPRRECTPRKRARTCARCDCNASAEFVHATSILAYAAGSHAINRKVLFLKPHFDCAYALVAWPADGR